MRYPIKTIVTGLVMALCARGCQRTAGSVSAGGARRRRQQGAPNGAARSRQSGSVRRDNLEIWECVYASTGYEIWNPAKIKLLSGGKLVGGTVSSGIDPSTYCAMANAGYDFIWTEMQHANNTWDQVGKAWRTCPNAKAVPGVRVPYADEFQNSACARCGRAGRGGSDRGFGRRSHRGKGLDVFSAIGKTQPRRRSGVRCRYVGQHAGGLSQHHQR